jgi:hypothetical protein
MEPELQKKILQLFHYTLTHQGVLFLGTSESIGEFENLHTFFLPMSSKWKIFKYNRYVIDRMTDYPNAIQIHTPEHASWLNQIEIYFSILQRKLLTPKDFDELKILEHQLLAFRDHYEKIAKPLKWEFTKKDLNKIFLRLSSDTVHHEKLAA